MFFFRNLLIWVKEDELMDDFFMGGEELCEVFQYLCCFNKIFVVFGFIFDGVEKLWIFVGRFFKLIIMDVGVGLGDVNQKLFQWVKQKGIEFMIILVDLIEEVCEEVRLFF